MDYAIIQYVKKVEYAIIQYVNKVEYAIIQYVKWNMQLFKMQLNGLCYFSKSN
jgi:hypothetical protein